MHFTSVPSHSESYDSDSSNINDIYHNDTDDKEPSSELECSSVVTDDPMMLEMIMVKDVNIGAEVCIHSYLVLMSQHHYFLIQLTQFLEISALNNLRDLFH